MLQKSIKVGSKKYAPKMYVTKSMLQNYILQKECSKKVPMHQKYMLQKGCSKKGCSKNTSTSKGPWHIDEEAILYTTKKPNCSTPIDRMVGTGYTIEAYMHTLHCYKKNNLKFKQILIKIL